MPKILLVEDDQFHRQVIEQALRDKWQAELELVEIRTEKQFHDQMRDETTQNAAYDLVILDQMLPWTTEDDDDESAEPVEGPLRAGSRCSNALKAEKATAGIPQIFFTNLGRNTVPDYAAYIRKKDSSALQQLVIESERLIDAHA